MGTNEKHCWAIIISFASALLLGIILFTPPLFQFGYNPLFPEPVTAAQLMRVNINSASAETLKSLPGLGDKKAMEIVNYRNINGDFQTIEDILLVNGVSEKDLENWQPYLYIQ